MLFILFFFAYSFASEEVTTEVNLYDGEFADQIMISYPIDNRTDSELTLLELLDRNICTIIMDPYGVTGRLVTKQDGDSIINNMKLFKKYVIKAKGMWIHKNMDQDKALVESVKVMYKKGWPQFMILTIEDNGEHMMKGLNWNVDDMYEFYEYRSQANEEWDDLRSIIECE
uniref:Uncharacterized protein n=1 Tax=Clastoptera arizonana TaxID=38151 RepID=A0A1B6BXK4_9HEMI